MDIGKTITITTSPKREVQPAQKPAETPIKVPNWPVKKPETVPNTVRSA